jgi:hypothetical protein
MNGECKRRVLKADADGACERRMLTAQRRRCAFRTSRSPPPFDERDYIIRG